MKIVHTADWHISLQRREEKQRVINNLIEYCNSNNVDLLVVAGDNYDKTPSASDQAFLVDALISLNCPSVILRGNHDPEGYINLLSKIKSKNDIIVIDKITPQAIYIPSLKLNIFGLPHLSKNNIVNQLPDLATSQTDQTIVGLVNHAINGWSNMKSGLSICVGHCSVTGSIKANGQSIEGRTTCLSTQSFDSLDMPVMLGHIHCYQALTDNVVYSGNLCRVSFDETDDKGFVLWEYDGQWRHEFIKNDARELITIEANYNTDGFEFNRNIDVIGKEVRFRYQVDKNLLGTIDFTEVHSLLKNAYSYKLVQEVTGKDVCRSSDIFEAVTISSKLDKYQDLHGKPERDVYIREKLNEIEDSIV